jgi:hypothetical protein
MFPFRDVRSQCRLQTIESNDWVYWSHRKESGGGCNSYTLQLGENGPWLYKGQRVYLLSVNGIGETRWEVRVSDGINYPDTGRGGEGAVKYFGLAPA